MLHYWNIAILSFFISNLICQNGNIVQNLGSHEGLIHGFSDFIYRDSRDLMWISSDNGVYRYNGVQLEHFRNDPIKGPFGEIVMSDFFETSNGDIYFSTNMGINKYIRSLDSFEMVQLSSRGDSLTSHYYLLRLEGDSILWSRVGAHLCKIDLKTKDIAEVSATNSVRFSHHQDSSSGRHIIIGCPWMISSGVELFKFNDENLLIHSVILDRYVIGNTVKHPKFSQVVIQDDSTAWGISDYGLFHFNYHDQLVIGHYPLDFVKKSQFRYGELTSEGELLLTNNQFGILSFDTFNKEFSNSINVDSGLKSNATREIYTDQNDIHWVSHKNSSDIDYYYDTNSKFYNPLSGLAQVGNQKVNTIVQDKDQHIWCSTASSGIYKFDLRGELLDHFATTDLNRDVESYNLSIDHHGDVWATGGHQVFQFISNGFWSERYKISDERVFSIIHMDSVQKILITNDGFLSVDVISQKKTKIGISGINTSALTVTHHFDGSGNTVYIPYNTLNLLLCRIEHDSLRYITTLNANSSIYSICENNDTLWLGTANGLAHKDISSDNISPISTGDPHSQKFTAYATILDDNRRMWMASVDGLRSFHLDSRELVHYRLEDGLVSNRFTHRAFTQDSEGKIWLGTDKGLVVFHPDSISPYPHRPTVHLTNLMINGELYDGHGVLDQKNNLSLNHSDNSINFKAVAINYYMQENNRLFYRLIGSTNEWIETKNGSSISFLLPPGDYLLEVYGTNTNGLKSELRQLDIFIQKPVWQKLWFITLILFSFTIALVQLLRFVYHRRLRMQEAAHKREIEIAQLLQVERDRIAADMHDDLGGGLTSIKLLIHKALKKQFIDEAKPALKRIEEYSSSLVDNMQSIIWTMNSKYDDLGEAIVYIRYYIMDFFDDHSIKCVMVTPKDVPHISLSGEKRRNLFLCVKEVVHNVIKHAQADQVNVTIELNDNQLTISITDDGVGMSSSSQFKRGLGIQSLEKRMEAIGGTALISCNNGTEVQLSLVI